MAEIKVITGANFVLDGSPEPRSFGVIKDTRFVRCLWPKLDQPTKLFADGSSGIEVQGPPTPRNVIFPPDTVFLPVLVGDGPVRGKLRFRQVPGLMTKADCFFTRTYETREVEEDEEFPINEVIDGEMRNRMGVRKVTVRREFEVLTDISPEEAMRMAEGQ